MTIEKKYQVVFFSSLPYADIEKHGFRKTSGSMLKEILASNKIEKVFFVYIERRWSLRTRVRKVSDKLTVINVPVGLPFERFYPIRKINRLIQSSLLRHQIADVLKNSNLLYWFYDWLPVEIIQHLPPKTTIMEVTDSIDNYYETNAYISKLIPQLRDFARERVDLAYSVNINLMEELKDFSHSKHLRNSLDDEWMRKASNIGEEPGELNDVARPRMLLIGSEWSLNHRIDHKLLADSLKLLPEWSLIIIGCPENKSVEMESLCSLANVKTIGLVSKIKLIDYIQHSDVCVIPYRMESKKWGEPLKFYEYLSCGKPIVTTFEINNGNVFSSYFHKISSASELSGLCREYEKGAHIIEKEARERITGLLGSFTWKDRLNGILNEVDTICHP